MIYNAWKTGSGRWDDKKGGWKDRMEDWKMQQGNLQGPDADELNDEMAMYVYII